MADYSVQPHSHAKRRCGIHVQTIERRESGWENIRGRPRPAPCFPLRRLSFFRLDGMIITSLGPILDPQGLGNEGEGKARWARIKGPRVAHLNLAFSSSFQSLWPRLKTKRKGHPAAMEAKKRTLRPAGPLFASYWWRLTFLSSLKPWGGARRSPTHSCQGGERWGQELA